MTAPKQCQPGSDEAWLAYENGWRRILWDATGDQTKVDRVIELARLNGLFDPVFARLSDSHAGGVAQTPSIRNDMRALFRHVDDQDWEYLISRIGDGGRDRFWKTVIADVRGALAVSSTSRATPKIIGRVTGKEYDGDQVAGMPNAICHACGLNNYPCVNPDCPNKAAPAKP